MMQRFSLRLALAAGLLVPLTVLAVGIFPDVGDDHPFKADIESLARAGIVKGNPDGKYYPEKSVNRAEFLKLLYVAAGRQPKAIYAGCFGDVEQGSWYEAFVCDAAAKENGFVQGYSDGKFRPGSPVNRTEALKMLFTVFALPAPDISTMDQELIKFVDVSVSAWYSKYLSAAYQLQILPIAGQSGSRFYPDKELTRGEAAAYIFNAMNAKTATSASSSSVSSTVSSVESSESSSAAKVKQVVFPFTDTDKFIAKEPVSYMFNLTDSKTVVHVEALVIGFYQSDITCRLYRLSEEGFSYEYYLGIQSANSCMLNVAVPAGSYQLQLQPLAPDVSFTVTASKGVSDGNDGFMEAVQLKADAPRTATLTPNDLYDWYSFTVPTDTEMNATVEVVGTSSVSCIIYTPASVDQYGFSGPECGKAFLFAAGTYTVGIGRKTTDLQTTLTYTINWR